MRHSEGTEVKATLDGVITLSLRSDLKYNENIF